MAFCTAICLGWQIVLLRTPTDGLVGTGSFQGDQFWLRAAAPTESPWAESGVSIYRAILRVDARNIIDWLTSPAASPTSWQPGNSHQYLVDRRDGDGKRVITSTLQLPQLSAVFGADVLAVVLSLLVVLLIGRRAPDLPALLPLVLMACGGLLALSWQTLAIPFSYVALGWPFWGQLILHSVGSAILLGALTHVALTFVSPLDWHRQHRRLTLGLVYGLYPIGLLIVVVTQPTLAARLTAIDSWQQQAGIALRGITYLAWGAQYRRANVNQRGQLHWILAGSAAYDLPYLLSTLAGVELTIQSWLAILPPLGYLMAIVPDRRWRFRLTATSGLIHGMANTLVAALFLAGLGLAANVLITSGQGSLLPVGTLILAILFALTTVPLMDLLREQLDSWFNGTRGQQRALIHQFTGKVSDQISLAHVTGAFREALDQGVQPAFAVLWLWDADSRSLQSLDVSGETPSVIPVEHLDRLLALTTFTVNGQLAFWPEGQHYYGAIALVSSGALIGVCAIGPRIDGAAYSGDALRFLETLVRSATLAFRNAQLVSQLEDKIEALRYAYRQLITAQETERRNLAAELHDETLQQLAHANLITAQVQLATKNAGAPIEDLQQTIMLTERRLREILKGVHPAVLTDLGLEAALRSWLPRPKGIAVVLTAPDFAGRRLPDADLEMTLYRLTQEGVNNALKHAQATRIDILLQWQADQVMLEVCDNGIGFSPSSRFSGNRHPDGAGHFGLLNLHERVRAFGGDLHIDSSPGRGTRLCARLPVQGGTRG